MSLFKQLVMRHPDLSFIVAVAGIFCALACSALFAVADMMREWRQWRQWREGRK
jgi:hypothetical protein